MKKFKQALSLIIAFTVLSTSYAPLISQAQGEQSSSALTIEKESPKGIPEKKEADSKDDDTTKKESGALNELNELEEEKILKDMFQDSSIITSEVIQKLFTLEEPLTRLMNLDEKIRESFFKTLSQEELYQTSVLYKYALISEIVKIVSDKDSEQPSDQKEMLTKRLDQYVALQLLFQKSCNEQTSVEVSKEQMEEWDAVAFDIVAEKYKDLPYKDDTEEKKITSFVIYAEYLQKSTKQDIPALLSLFESMDTLSKDSKDWEVAVTTAYDSFYTLYGFIEVPETDAPKVDAPKENVPETDAPKVDAPKENVPETDTPEVDVPKAEAPEVDTPEKPETEVTLENLFKDEESSFEAVILKLYEETQPAATLQKLDKETRVAFYSRRTEEELYMFTQLYKYTLISYVIDDSNGKSKSTKEEVNSLIDIYDELIEIRDEKKWIPDEKQYLKWDLGAFKLLPDKIKATTYFEKEQEKSVVNFITYAEYLQSISSIDTVKLLELFNAMDITADPDRVAENKKKIRKYLYLVYGYEDEETLNKKQSKVRRASRGTFNKMIVKPSGMAGGTETHYMWVFVKITNPSGHPTLAYRPSHIGTSTNVAMNAGSYYQDGEYYNYAFPMKANGFYGEYTYNVNVDGSWVGSKTFKMGSMRVGGTYYWDLNHTVDNTYSGAIINVVRNCTMYRCVVIVNKDISIRPDNNNVTLKFSVGNNINAIISERSNINVGGGSGTITLDGLGGQISENTGLLNLIGSANITLNIYSNARIYNSNNGLIGQENSFINVEAGALIYNHIASGIASAGRVNVKGGKFYNNGQDGITIMQGNNTYLTVTAGEFYNNGRAGIAFGGIIPEHSGNTYTATLSGGSSYSNGAGLYLTTNTNNYWNVNATGMTIRNNTKGMSGNGGGAYINPRCTLILNGSTIHSNSATNGGAVYINGGGLNFKSGTIRDNAVSSSGGGIYNNGILSISGGTVSSNKATYGGALLNSTGKTANITGGTFSSNTATYGGGLFNKGTTMTVNGTVKINSNKATSNGGGVYNESGTLRIATNNVNISSNSCDSNGGGVAVANGTLDIAGGIVSSNIAGNYGGGIYVAAGAVKDMIVTATKNTATNYGGGIFTQVDTPLSSCTITNNNAETQSGGGVYMNYKTLTITDSNISSNIASNVGGGVATYEGKINFVRGSIKSNTAGNSAGAIYVGGTSGNPGSLTMSNGTVDSNKAAKHGGAIYTNQYCTSNIKGGSISNNSGTHGGAVFNNSNATLNVTGGSIYQNAANYGGAIFNQSGKGTFNLSGGTIYSNTGKTAGGGVYNENTAVMNMWGGDISSNISPLGSGIYQNGALNIAGAVWINNNNDVYLLANKVVKITGALSSAKTVALLTPADYSVGRVVAETTYKGSKGSAVFNKFALTKKDPYLLRPGDYQSGSGKAATDVVLSRTYAINYNKNTTNSVTNMPVAHTKYWWEVAKVAAQTPLLAGRPVSAKTPFKGWNEDAAAKASKYQPNADIPASINKDTTLYAIWDKFPEIQSTEQTFYEGFDFVGEQEILGQSSSNESWSPAGKTTANDLEDGNITKNLKVVKLVYPRFEKLNGTMSETYTKNYPKGMKETDRLCDRLSPTYNWFMDMEKNVVSDEKGIPVTVTASVTDQAGNTTTKDFKVYIKYNRYPAIESPDRYFSYEEAKAGKITEDILIDQALTSGTLTVSDKETKKSKLTVTLDKFDASAFKSAGTDSKILVTYMVQDDYGPGGKGKVTYLDVPVYIMEDGAGDGTSEWATEPRDTSVRFVNEKTYKRNAGKKADELTTEKQSAVNASGGLNVESLWYQDTEYSRLILESFAKTSGDTYVFDKEKATALRKYILNDADVGMQGGLEAFADAFGIR